MRSRSSFTTSIAPSRWPSGHLVVPLGEASLDRVGLVAPPSKSFGLGLATGRDEQHQQGVGRSILHLRGTLHVDLEHEVAARVAGRRGSGVP